MRSYVLSLCVMAMVGFACGKKKNDEAPEMVAADHSGVPIAAGGVDLFTICDKDTFKRKLSNLAKSNTNACVLTTSQAIPSGELGEKGDDDLKFIPKFVSCGAVEFPPIGKRRTWTSKGWGPEEIDVNWSFAATAEGYDVVAMRKGGGLLFRGVAKGTDDFSVSSGYYQYSSHLGTELSCLGRGALKASVEEPANEGGGSIAQTSKPIECVDSSGRALESSDRNFVTKAVDGLLMQGSSLPGNRIELELNDALENGMNRSVSFNLRGGSYAMVEAPFGTIGCKRL